MTYPHRAGQTTTQEGYVSKHTRIILTDDLTGGEATQTVTFGIDGAVYEIDLNDDNASNLRSVLAAYVQHARKLRATRKHAPTGRRDDLDKIRSWARANGHDVADRGRIARKIIDAYNTAHSPLAA